ncbi:MAG TPA: serine hydrolase [Aggregatilineaceae bacterium]|nr:serine hydrolase [Aggregatilineaceae bacterium]
MADYAPLPPRDYWPTHGWRDSPPEDQGLDREGLQAAHEHLTRHVPHIDGLLVVRHGYLVYERYGGSAGPAKLHNVKSATKSVLSALIGIAIQTGDLAGVDEPLGYILPDAFGSISDRRKRAITVRDLLTMRSGLEWDEYGPSDIQMTASPDWVRFVLERPLAHLPGTAFNYSTGDTQLLSAALQMLTSLTALAFADLYLFGPLGILQRAWPADPQGITVGGAELALTPRDMAKFGYLYLNRGQWEGEVMVPAAWIEQSTQPNTTFEPVSEDDCAELGYGYLWWLRPQGPFESFIAVGFAGQFIYVIPALDLVVVMTGDIASAPDRFRDNRMLCQFNLVEEYIVPAVFQAG